MAYTKKQVDEIFNNILNQISQEGLSLRKVLKQTNTPSSQTFYNWLEEDEEKSKQYARACEERQEILFDEIISIADENNADAFLDKEGKIVIVGNTVQRSRLKVDARKWALSKMNPKKYGDKVDFTTNGESLNYQPIWGKVDPVLDDKKNNSSE